MIVQGAQLPFVGVQTSPSTVQQASVTLLVYSQLVNAVPVNGYVQITIPTEMSVKVGTLTCSMTIPATASIKSCTANGKIITAVLSTSLPVDAFEMHIQNAVTNPQSTTPTSTFSFITYTSAGVIIDQLSQGISLVATEGTMTTQSLTPASQVVGATTTLEIRFKPVHDIPAGALIKVTFPKWNPSASTAQQVEYLQGAISCSTVAVLSASLSCSFTSSVLSVTGASQKLITGGTEVALSVSGFRNPLSTSTISGFKIQTQDSALGNIDTALATIKVSTAAAIITASVTVDSTTTSAIAGIVQESNKMRINFNSPVPLNSQCKVKVTLPSQFSVSTVKQISLFGLFGIQSIITPTITLTDNSFSFTQCTAYTSNTLTASITIDSLSLPQYTKSTGSFGIQVSNSASDVIASVTTGVTFTASSGAFAAPVILPVTATVLATTNIRITIVPTHAMDTTARLSMTFPTNYVMSSSCTLSSLLNINANAVCTISGQTLTITNLLSSAYPANSGRQLAFTFSQAKLPPTTQAQSFQASFLVTDATDSQLYTVDSFIGNVNIAINFGAITAKATPSSLIAYDSAIYTFEFTPEHQVPFNGFIKIIYPSSVTISNPSFSQSQCSGFLNFPTSPTCSIDTSTRTILVNNGFRVQGTPAGGTKYTLKVPGIQNPISLDVSDTFQIFTITSDSLVMDAIQTGLTVQMTSTAFMRSVLVSLGSYVNTAVTKYTFTITTTVPVLQQQYIIVQFPTQIKIPTSDSSYNCYSDDNLIIDQITCTTHSLLTNAVKAEVYLRSGINQINVLQTFRITIQSITNPPTTQSTSGFLVQLTNRQFGQLNRNPGTLTIQTNTPKTLSKATLVANTTGAGQYAKYTITITPESQINLNGGVQIIYPSQVSVPGTITTTLTSAYTKVAPIITIDKSARQILLKSSFQQNFIPTTTSDTPTIIITLEGFKNPLLNDKSNSFIIRTFNVDSANTNLYYIDQVTDGLLHNRKAFKLHKLLLHW